MPAIARASTILSENFDELTAQLSATSVGAFTAINGTNVDIVGPGDGFGYLCAAPASGNCVDLDGSGGNPQGILQSSSITLNPGVSYDLTFDLLGSQRGNQTSTTVDFGGYSQTFVLASNAVDVVNQMLTVGTVTTTNLTFISNTPGDEGAILDNVGISASSNVNPTPEPSSIVLTGTALLLSAGMFAGRRRFV